MIGVLALQAAPEHIGALVMIATRGPLGSGIVAKVAATSRFAGSFSCAFA